MLLYFMDFSKIFFPRLQSEYKDQGQKSEPKKDAERNGSFLKCEVLEIFEP